MNRREKDIPREVRRLSPDEQNLFAFKEEDLHDAMTIQNFYQVNKFKTVCFQRIQDINLLDDENS
jgi:hypothetical protein